MELIDKAVVVAEIEDWRQHTLKCGYAGQGEYEEGNKQGRLDTCEKFLSFLDTLEVKEVDLEKEIEEYCKSEQFKESLGTVKVTNLLAKHFFELGLKAQKGE